MKKVLLFLAAALMGMAVSAQVTTFPWTEGFESGATGWTIIDSDGDGICWQLSDTSSQIANFAATYPRTGNSCIIALSYNNLTYEALTPDEWLISPALTIPAGESYTLTFYDNGTNANYAAEHYAVHVASANTVAAMSATTALMEQTLSTGDWIKRSVDLSAYAGQTIYIGFRHFNCTDQFCLGIDDIRVGGSEAPELTVTGPASALNGVAVTYTATSTVSTLAWYVDGVQQTETSTTFTTTFTTDGNHEVVASATNAIGTTNDTIITNVYTCNAIATFPFTEGFENGLGCWTMVSNDPANDDLFGLINYASYVHGGSYSFCFSSYNQASDYNQYLISPELDLDASNDYELKFWYYAYNASETFRVLVSTTTNAPSAFTTVLADITSPAASAWTELTYALPAGTKYVAINYYGNYQYYLFVDDFSIGGPSAPTISLAGPASVALNSQATFTATTTATTLAWYVDGVQQTETSATFSTSFSTVGNHTVKVSATNSVGTASDSIVVNVMNASVTTFPWVEDFEANATAGNFGTFPVGWTTYADNVANYSQYADFGQSWSVYDFGWFGDGSAICLTYTNSTTACDRWLVTPQLVMPATGDFKLKFDVYGSQYSEKLAVLVSTTGNAKADFTQTVMPQTTLAAGENTMLFDLSAYVGQSIYIAFRCTTTDGMYTLVDNVTVSADLPATGISYADGMVQGFVPMGTNFSFYTMVRNEGTTPMTSYTLTYTVNGTAHTRNVTGINVAPFAYYIDTVTISHPTAEAVTIGLEVSAPNGVADPDASDNTGSLSLTVYDPATVAERTSLLEHFTTAVCPNCPAGHDRLHQAIVGYEDRIAWVAHHCGYYTDDMTLAEDAASTGIMGFYSANGGSGSFAPAMMLDRNVENVPVSEGGLVGSVSSNVATIQSQFANATSTSAFVTVGLENITYNASTREVSFDVNGMFKSSLTGTVNVTVYVTEDSIMGTQSGATGTYRHDHVLRGVVTSYWGDALTSTNANETYSKHYTYTLPATWNYEKCRLIAFVNKHDASFANRQVLNATKSAFLTASQVGIEDVKPAISVKMWPNPVAEMAFVEAESTIRSYSVVNSVGQVVESRENVNASALELNVSNYAAGVYFVSVTTDNGVSTERLSVVK